MAQTFENPINEKISVTLPSQSVFLERSYYALPTPVCGITRGQSVGKVRQYFVLVAVVRQEVPVGLPGLAYEGVGGGGGEVLVLPCPREVVSNPI